MSTDKELREALEEIPEDFSVNIDEEIREAFSGEYDTSAVSQILEYIFELPTNERNMYINIMVNAARPQKHITAFKEQLKQFKLDYAQQQRDELVTGYSALKNMPEGLEEIAFQYKTGDFILEDSGISKSAITKDGDFTLIPICSQPVMITARMKNVQDGKEQIIIKFYSRHWQSITAEREIISSHTKAVQLAGYGLDITSETAKNMVAYFQCVLQKNIDLIPVHSTINRLGWYKGEFIPYSDKIRCDAAENFRDIYTAIATKGDYETWKQHCYKLRENTLFRLTMAASFAAPLIFIVGGLPFILHLWGGSGTGKTVSLHVAASVWGNPEGGALVKSLNGTDFAITEVASFLYSLPCILNELQTIKEKGISYNSLVMNITEGVGRMQGAAAGGIRETKKWKNCFLTTGEENIVKYNSGGGTINRVISIDCSTEKIVEDGPGTMNIIKDNYGFAGIDFIKGLQNENKLYEKHRMIFETLLHNTDATDKQCMAMSFLILADKLSCDYIFTENKPLALSDVEPYMASKKYVDVAERCHEWIHDWVSQNINRFDHIDHNNGEVWGKRETDYIMINKTVLTQHMEKAGFDYGAVIPEFAKRGYIIRSSTGKCVHQTTVNLHKASYIKLIRKLDDDRDLHDILTG